VLAIILLALFAALAASFATETGMNLRKATNQAKVQHARLQAESGLAYLSYLLRQVALPPTATGQVALDSLAASLQARLDGTANLAGQTVSYDGTHIVVPAVSTSQQNNFSAVLCLNQDGSLRVSITGTHADCVRGVRISYEVVHGWNAVCRYGLASKSRIRMSGQGSFAGANDPAEANMFSATYSDPLTFELKGQSSTQGDVHVVNSSGAVSVSGQATVAGCAAGSPELAQHTHFGVDDINFPEADPGLFEPFAVNIVDQSTRVNQPHSTFSNIRILANTNPNFATDTTLMGVVFIETPKRVTFAGRVSVIGVIATEDAGEDALDDNYIRFSGQASVQGVDHLPDDPQFASLKALPGTVILAPGFALRFSGQFGTLGGSMGASQFEFTGQASGLVHGWIINWGDTEFSINSQASLTIDHDGLETLPFGFVTPARLFPLPRTYEEY